MLRQKSPFLFIHQVHIRHLNAFLLRAPMIILRLNLHKLKVRDAIGAEAYLLAVCMPVLMGRVHVEVGCIKVCGIILQIAFAVNLLYEIILLRHFQQLTELLLIRHKLSVYAIHQFYAFHLFQRYRSKRVNQFRH